MSDAATNLAQIIADAARALAGAGGPPLPIAREGADTRARWPVAIPQATGQDSTPRGVWVRALSAGQRLDAELAATQWALRRMASLLANPQTREAAMPAFDRLLERRIVIEEAARMIVDPPDLPVGAVEGWGDAVVQTIHLAGVRAEEYPAELVAAELARLHRGPLPAEPAPLAGEREPAPDDVDAPAHAAA